MNCQYSLIEILPDTETSDSLDRWSEFKILNDIFLDTGKYSSEYVNFEDYMYHYYYNDLSPPEMLNDTLKQIVLQFIKNMGLLNIVDNVSDENWTVDESALKQIVALRNVLGEQLEYMDRDDYQKDDISRRFCCKIICNREVIGEVYAFQNPNDHPEWMVIQGMSHSLAAGLSMILFPKLRNYLPRINSIIDLGLTELAKLLGVHDILVYPLSYQGKILQQYYGYERTDTLFYPSPYIVGGPQARTDILPELRLFKTIRSDTQ